ncbi:MAG: radical SAM protein [Candidatus Omnitrophica bacterium]|nr:radical SAM protein [Candidatus Omnitrophota bacterium]
MISYTQLHATNRQNLVDVLPLKKPFTVLIEPSSLCNFRCVHCFQSLKEENFLSRLRLNMDLSLYRKIIEQLRSWSGAKLKVLKLSLYGEPLLNPDFAEMLKMAKHADIAERVETTTNASLLTRKIAQGMVDHQLDYLRVSVYSPDQQKHEDITGSKLDIRSIHDNLSMLQELKKLAGRERPFVAVKMLDTYGPGNDDFIKMYQDVADEIYIDKPHNWTMTEGARFTDALYKDTAAAVQDMHAESQHRRVCPMAFTTMAVRSNGDVAPCCIDFNGGTNLGNVNRIDLKGLWLSEAWHKFMLMQLEDRKQDNVSCSRCDFYKSGHYIKDNIDGFDARKLRC